MIGDSVRPRVYTTQRRQPEDRGLVRLGYGDGQRGGDALLGGQGRHGTTGRGQIGINRRSGVSGIASRLFDGWRGDRDGRWGHRQGNRHWEHYNRYSRCYASLYATYRPFYYSSYYYPYSSYYNGPYSGYYRGPYSGYYYGDPYYSHVTLFDYAYRPLVPSYSNTTVIYTQDGEGNQDTALGEDGSAGAYYTVPSDTPAAPGEAYSYSQPAPEAAVPQEPAGPTDASGSPVAGESHGSWVELGNTAFSIGRYDEARHLYIRAVLADDTDGYAKLLYGLANFAIGDYGAAVTAVRRALEASPELIDDPIDLRALYEDSAVLSEQMGRLAALAESSPADHQIKFLLGYMYFATGNPESSLQALESVVESRHSDSLAGFVRDSADRVVRMKHQGQQDTEDKAP